MNLAELTEKMRNKLAQDEGVPNIIKLDFGADGIILYDGKSTPHSITNEDGPADCTIRIKLADLLDIISGRKSAQAAFMFGKLKVDGDLSVAMKLSRLLG